MLDQDGHLHLMDFGISLQNIMSCCHGVSKIFNIHSILAKFGENSI